MPSPLEGLQLLEQIAHDNLAASLLVAVILMTTVVSVPIPFGSFFSAAMGYLYGVLLGATVIVFGLLLSTFMLVSIGATRDAQMIARHEHRFRAFASYFDGLFKVVLLRQVSVLPNFFFCLAARFYQTPRSRILLGTAIGAWPNAALATYLGASLNSLIEVGDPSSRPSAIIGVAVSVAALVTLSLVSKRLKRAE